MAVWALKIAHGNITPTYAAAELGSLMQKYKVKPVVEYEGEQNYNGDMAVQTIWEQALEKLGSANDLLSEKSEG